MNKRLRKILTTDPTDIEAIDPAGFRSQRSQMIKYRLSADNYNKMWWDQEGKCAICKGKCITGKALSIDHCHKTNEVRGLLCSRCNTALGLLEDDIDRLKTAIDYLKSS